MTAIEIARRMEQLGETGEALRAYALALRGGVPPEETLEAAAFLLGRGAEDDRGLAFTALVRLHGAGRLREEALSLLRAAVYEPEAGRLRSRYERNLALLAKYPYLFRRDFLPFGELPLVFFPYGESGYVPYDPAAEEFRGFFDPDDTVIGRSFFGDLEKPVLAEDVISQYELAYLNDNVRPSEWVGRENHIYLHYTDWGLFCAYLQVLDLKPLLGAGKFVFLIGDELAQYPIDFKERFGVDYGRYSPRQIGIREIHKLIWHTQFSAHNGGDFFNEIFDAHPNLLSLSSVMFDDVEAEIAALRAALGSQKALSARCGPRLAAELRALKNVTDKDLLVACYLRGGAAAAAPDPAARIAPAIFFQPHFGNILYQLEPDGRGRAAVASNAEKRTHDSPILSAFRYIKTFTPIRRPTTSYAASVRFAVQTHQAGSSALWDEISERVQNRSFMRDPDDRLYRDSVIVRFEDGKLEPEATFTALAAFLDVPYTESMTYGSIDGDRDPYKIGDNYAKGFATGSVNAKYPQFANDTERYYLEYFLRDAYTSYGYDFQYYDGAVVDEAKAMELLAGFTTLDGYIRKSWREAFLLSLGGEEPPESREAAAGAMTDEMLRKIHARRRYVTGVLLRTSGFVNRRGQPLEMIPLLAPRRTASQESAAEP